MNFSNLLTESAKEKEIELNSLTVGKLQIYFEMLMEWNKRINLTSITEEKDVVIKHFLDSLVLLKHIDIPENAKLIDVGTGAGFPGLVLKIVRPDLRISLLDSLNKRLRFIAEVVGDLRLRDVELMHFRAEFAGKMDIYREQYDFSVARAVAPMSQLLEYCVPFIKMDGQFIAMKSKKAQEEIEDSEGAATALGAKFENCSEFRLPGDFYRCLVFYRKFHSTPKRYPRQTGQIRKKELGGKVRVV